MPTTRGGSPPGPRLMAPSSFEGQDWRAPPSLEAAWSPLNYGMGGGDTWKPMGAPSPWGGEATGLAVIRHQGVVAPPEGGSRGPLCGSCTDQHLVTSRCRDCSEDLCDSCVVAHQRVKLTREHTIVRYPDTPAAGSKPGFFGLPVGAKQQTHNKGPGPAANADVLRVFNETVEKAKVENQANMEMARMGYQKCEQALVMKQKMEQQILGKARQVETEIELSKQQQIHAVEERHRLLYLRLGKIREVKLQALVAQEKDLRQAMLLLDSVVATLENAARSGEGMEIIDVNKQAADTIVAVQQSCGTFKPHEDDEIIFRAAAPDLVSSISGAGLVASSGFAPNCLADGDGLCRGVLGKEARFSVMVKDHLNEPNLTRGEGPKVEFSSPDGRPVTWNLQPDPALPGKYDVRWRPHMEGDHVISITLRGGKLPDSPFKCSVRAGRDYQVLFSLEFENLEY